MPPVSEEHNGRFRWGLDRFVTEARTVAQFKHPNIVWFPTVFTANNNAYLVMEYEQGGGASRACTASGGKEPRRSPAASPRDRSLLRPARIVQAGIAVAVVLGLVHHFHGQSLAQKAATSANLPVRAVYAECGASFQLVGTPLADHHERAVHHVDNDVVIVSA